MLHASSHELEVRVLYGSGRAPAGADEVSQVLDPESLPAPEICLQRIADYSLGLQLVTSGPRSEAACALHAACALWDLSLCRAAAGELAMTQRRQ